jgi:Ca2+-binding EF-hand superfamily protein
MLMDASHRITAKQALESPWFTELKEEAETNPMEEAEMSSTLESLQNFRAIGMLQKVALSYIAAQHISPEEEQSVKELYASLDADHNGCISLNELIVGYHKMYGDSPDTEKIALETIKKIDTNFNGIIDYNGKQKGIIIS